MSEISNIKNKKTIKRKEKETTEKHKFEEKILELEQQLIEKNDKLLRTCADLQNYQKRTLKEIQQREEEIKNKYLSELIEIKELIIKAYEDKNPKQGLKLILQNLDRFFEKEQISCIECVGKSFDHTLHHAITTVEKNDCENNTIIGEIKKGYLVNDKVLRPSQVIVVKNKEKNDKVVE
ncbi:MAG: nucleotide exchange factor GrpE [Thermoplasmatota archaeon]